MNKSEMQQNIHFENNGFCFSCDAQVKFIAYGSWLRDQYLCSNCSSIPRERAVMYCIEKYLPNWRNLIIHESSPVFRGTSLRLKNEATHYIPSYFYPGIKSGNYYNGFRCENLEELSFEENSIDIHITQDVMEHIFDVESAFSEIARTLKPGGMHIFTTPLVNKNNPTEETSIRNADGSVSHYLQQPEYHGNPISENGSLVTRHWGYDITKIIFLSCGLFTDTVYIDDLERGIRAELIEVLITRK